MGRRRGKKNKKKATEPPAALPPPPAPNQPKKKQNSSAKRKKRTYRKVKAIYLCSRGTCRKSWSSWHGWYRDDEVPCRYCDAAAKVINMTEGNCELENYNCWTCGHFWQAVHNDDEEECVECGDMVTPQGFQKRFGCVKTYVCKNSNCAEEFQEFSANLQRSQRCAHCHARGTILRIERTAKRNKNKNRNDSGHPCAKGSEKMHNWELCDMCADLKGQGKAETCIPVWRVKCQVVMMAPGIYTERFYDVN